MITPRFQDYFSDPSEHGPNFIIKDLPSVLILIIADQILNDSMCCSNKYKWCLCRFIGKLYIVL